MRLPMRNQSTQMWHTWTPYFNPQPPPAPWALLAFNCSHPCDGAAAGTKVGSALATGSYLRASKWILWRLQLADFREKWEAESLSPISSSVSALEAPRRFGRMEKKQPGLSVGRKHQAGQSSRLLCNISQTDYNKNRGRKACQERMALIS